MKKDTRSLKKGYNRLYSAVREIVNKEDPIGLIEMEAPSDEYDPEINAVLRKLRPSESVESLQAMIHAVFVEWFGADVAGGRERYRSIAEQIKALKDAP